MAKHLVTGGAGFVGSHMAEFLISIGEDVRVFDVDSPDIKGTKIMKDVDYCEGDVRNMKDVNRAVEGIDYVHHNIAKVPLTKAGKEFEEINVGGTRNVMKASLGKVRSVSHISSSAVYDISSMPVTEGTRTDPIGRYGKSKLESDQVAQRFSDKGLSVNILRPRTVVDERRAGIFQILFDWIRSGEYVYMLGDGENYFQLISGPDLARASYKAVTSNVQGEIINVGNDDYNKLREDILHLIRYADSRSSVVWVPALPSRTILEILDKMRLSPFAPWHYKTIYKDYYFDTTKAKDLLNWKPKDGNKNIFERSYNWFLNHRITESSSHQSAHRTAPKKKILKLLRIFS